MKKLFFAVSALAALTLLVPSAGFAQTALNQIGLYTDAAGVPSSASFNPTANVPFSVYLVVTNPVNHAFNDGAGTPPYERVMTAVSGFESQVGFWTGPTAGAPTLPGLFVLSQTFNGSAIRLGEGNEYVVGFAAPVPVAGVAAMMMTFSIMVIDSDPKEVFLNTTSIPSIPGFMAIVDGSIESNNLQAAWPSSGDYANPVFGINTAVVAVETESWGNVKSLFR